MLARVSFTPFPFSLWKSFLYILLRLRMFLFFFIIIFYCKNILPHLRIALSILVLEFSLDYHYFHQTFFFLSLILFSIFFILINFHFQKIINTNTTHAHGWKSWNDKPIITLYYYFHGHFSLKKKYVNHEKKNYTYQIKLIKVT